MTTVSIREAKTRLTEFARRVENEETVVVTHNGKPVLDLVSHRPRRGSDFEAPKRRKAEHGVDRMVSEIPLAASAFARYAAALGG